MTSQLQSFAVARYPLTWSRVSLSASTSVRGVPERGIYRGPKLTGAGHEIPGEGCERPHHTIGVNRRFPVWLRPRQRHNRHNLCNQAAAREVPSCQQENIAFCGPGEGV